MEIETKELATIKGQVSKAITTIQALEITSDETLREAITIGSKIKAVGKMITERKESVTKPLNEALKNARALFAPLEAQYAEAESILKGKMSSYQIEVDRKAREEQAKLMARLEAGRLKPETVAKKIEAIEKVETTTKGDKGGAVQFRTVKEVVVVDESKIPDTYWVVDMVKLRKDALAGIEITGVKVEEKKIPVLY